ncbi:hypothetical protein CFOL_v3_03928 [Cephalotus follicularis]|uniref:CCHC-type domain-containing protein n=1 Tax=Cephalotus follicularis TaxID=3775 RepID=A0A1Q3AXE3_CEPFO|nr:hypothetical protein CFOL_v3_03928 [Cephalotus follicularis]
MESIEDYVDAYFTTTTYMRAYNNKITPLPGSDLVLDNDNQSIQQPPLKRLDGKPRNTIFKAPGEAKVRSRSSTVRCSNCQQFGHNIKGCRRALVTKKVVVSNKVKQANILDI